MTTMLKFDKPDERAPIIKVIGVGGGGSNAVSHMLAQGIKGVDFFICNTDSQSLSKCPVPNKIRLGTTGLGAGANPSVGRDAAIQIAEEIKNIIKENTSMLFITAGMGGGTGTGAAPIIAQIARDLGILTVGIITKPFSFEGRKREQQAISGIEELKKYVDTTLIICNDKLLEMQGDMKLGQAFGRADDVLTIAAKGIAEIITVTGRVNVDFEDVKTVMKDSGKAIMGAGIASGPDRAVKAIEMAMNSPLLDDTDIKGASNVLLYITSGKNEISIEELTEITGYITSRTGEDANVIWGDGIDDHLEDEISITLIATGFNKPVITIHNLDETQNLLHISPQPVVETITEVQMREPAPPAKANVVEPIRSILELKVDDVPRMLFNETVAEKTEAATEQKATLHEPVSERTIPEPVEIKSFFRQEPEIEIVNFQIKPEDKKPVVVQEPVRKPQIEPEDPRNDERRNKLKGYSYKPQGTLNIEEMEKTPAYMRRNVDMPEVGHQASVTPTTHYTLDFGDDKQANLREHLPFNKDSVD